MATTAMSLAFSKASAQLNASGDCKVGRIHSQNRMTVAYECTCGGALVTDRDEDGNPELHTVRCADDFCMRQLCEHARVQCNSCWLHVCHEHCVIMADNEILCRLCAAAAMSEVE